MAKTTTIFCGNNFVNVDFPDHTRILKAPAHDDFLEDPRKAVVDAVRNPLGMKPLKELVKAGLISEDTDLMEGLTYKQFRDKMYDEQLDAYYNMKRAD